MRIGNKRLTEQSACLIIAEIGVNHNGSAELGHKMIEAAVQAGANAIKFQFFKADKLVVKDAESAPYQFKNTGNKSQKKLLKSLEINFDCLRLFQEHCETLGVEFLCTAFDEESLAKVIQLNPSCLKWPSGEITNVKLLRQAIASGLPLLLSTGMSSFQEVENTLKFIERHSEIEVAVMQCVSDYPAILEDQNLLCIKKFREKLNLLTGFSDHTIGFLSAVIARSLGAVIFEKHFTLDKSLAGPDHKASATPEEFSCYVAALRETEKALGNGIKSPTKSEMHVATLVRKSLYYSRDLPAGYRLKESDITAMRPISGISAVEFYDFVGKELRVSVKRHNSLFYTDF